MRPRNTPTLDAISAPNAHRYHAEVMERARMMEEAIRGALESLEIGSDSITHELDLFEARKKLKGAL